jgi:hypothetical protein
MNDSTYMNLIRLRDRLDAEQNRLHKQLEDVRVKLDSVSMTLSLLDGDEISQNAAGETLYREGETKIDAISLQGMSQLAALKKIAEHNGGMLQTSLAKRLLNQAQLIKNPKNANNIIFSVIHRSEAFERVEPGVYRLIGDKPVRPEKTATQNLEF